MNTFFDRQLTQIKVQEMLQEAAEARADRKAIMADQNSITRTLKFALAVAVPLVLLIAWAFVAG